ncbi:MAG: UDP-N-acetylmuramoyl-L-alanyl-D-glutamate--2,6-diaminopimelate ligase [Candidatus Fermentithermobacillus carboniphilus]|uniref:UDP-N-acetylmuramoyl-L-alanyl-D-glutamate--2,6-diaminopimelate ligase n=1 Tax=Candidatus Fermentithermobacillus carboniphilus TaxID=3085328 RepID=A0AAT9LBP3_9FIRM|nr:MAG: UDP-N-acetylmuramoyl-L-alanyl-D-glutamate--2,6-diaminopimelate ligase [Candidatus Fermentithermobacillus carboniphilus]
MLLSELLKGLKGSLIAGDAEVTGLAYDSREVRPGFAFVAIRGFKLDGHDFAGDAVQRGARAIVAEKAVPVPPGTGLALVPNTRKALSHMAAAFYGYPSHELLVVGITGTKGKTTVCHLVKSVLDAGGTRAGLIGTVHNIVGEEVRPVTHTTPESLDLQRLCREMAEKGCRAVTMEVSSHALSLERVADIEFDVAVLTNIGRDHLDFHGTIENYLSAKAKLFEMVSERAKAKQLGVAPFSVLNRDEPYFEYFYRHAGREVLTYGFSPESDVRAEDVVCDATGTEFTLCFSGKKERVRINLPGRFNVSNALAAAAVGFGLSMDIEKVLWSLSQVTRVPGRIDVVPSDLGFTVWVDYAHTPESLKNVLSTAREVAKGRVIAVFGCGGDRDKGKRPIMGKVAAEISDVVIITNDNPRSEKEDEILDQIEEGIVEVIGRSKDVVYRRIKDRGEAIREAIKLARPGDIVVLAGKGHETYQVFKDKTVHFDDREEAKKALLELGRNRGS